MQGLMMLQDAVKQERRPLSWTVGEQGIIKPDIKNRNLRKDVNKLEQRSRRTQVRKTTNT